MDGGKGRGERSEWECSVLSTHLCYQSEMALKIECITFFNKMITTWQMSYTDQVMLARATMSSAGFYQILRNFNQSQRLRKGTVCPSASSSQNFIKRSQEGTFCTKLEGNFRCLAMEPL